jgi:hypothetical protein
MTEQLHPDDDRLTDFLLERLDAREMDRLRQHLAKCTDCRARHLALEPLAIGLQKLAAAGRSAPVPVPAPRWHTDAPRHREPVRSRHFGTQAALLAAALLLTVGFSAGLMWERRVPAATDTSGYVNTGAVFAVQRASTELTRALDSLTATLTHMPQADLARSRDVALSALIATMGAQSRIDPGALGRVVHAANAELSGASRASTRYVSF